jgi:Kef-type K+ transport system membrane component KefB
MEWIFHLGLILLAAKLGAELFQRMGLSAVVGEIAAGVVLGASVLHLVPESPVIEHLSELGVIFMIFLLGLETKIAHILEVGVTAGWVAIGGIVAPLAFGFGLGELIGLTWQQSLLLGSLLTATSIAVSTRVFLDCGIGRNRVSRTILAAAVIDDVVGLIVLTVVLAVTGHTQGSLAAMLTKEGLLLFVGFPLALYVIPKLVALVRRLEGEGAMFAVILGSTLLAAYGVVPLGMEPIIGAFLIGVVFGTTRESITVERQVSSLVHFLAPVFFVHIGLMLDLAVLTQATGLAVLLTLVAAASKLIGCGGAARLRRMSTLESGIVGIGMVPRGEVGLIIAGIGARLGIFEPRIFSAAALMCILTILIVPPLLRPLARRLPPEPHDAAGPWPEEQPHA